ncbi:MAG TPA: CusA/CzcA family heavy metal efflux RND transporter [Polyangiaceae bacterium]|nr:CusA/CzcA family heavy metal efflux RND transporter [Polyangiaceae bacterium]
MTAKLARLVLEHPLLSILGVLLLVVTGIQSYRTLPIDAVPDVTNVQVQVLTRASGLSPVEVERQVTQPVELTMTGIPRVQRIRSVSRAGVSAVTLVFDDGTDIDLARELVAQRLPRAREAVPLGAGRPELGPLTTGLGEVYHFTVRWPDHTLREARTLLDWQIAYRLRSVPGVVEVNSWGGETRQVEVLLRPEALLANHVTAAMVEAAVLGAGSNVSGGLIERSEEGTFVRAEAAYHGLEDVAHQVVATQGPGSGGRPVLVRDVADVRDGAEPRLSAATADGRGETIYSMVQMVAGGNAHDVVTRVKERLVEIRATLPAGVVIEPFYDRARFVDQVLSTVRRSLLEGGIVVALVLFFMLGDLRAGLVVASVIPLAMLGAFACMRYFGVSGNLLSLGAIDFGLVVDGAVVVVEGALAAMATHDIDAKRAMDRVAGEVGKPVTMGVLIIAVVYLPVLLLEGVEGRMFRPMALTVLFALMTSLVLTFAWVPAVSGLLLRRAAHAEPRVVRLLRRVYAPVARWLLPRWRTAMLTALLVAAVGVLVASRMGTEFVPRLEEGDLAIQVTRPPSVSLAEAIRGTTEIEQALKRFPEVERVVSRTGSPDVATDVMGIEQSDVFVILKPRDTWRTARDAAGFAAAFEPVLRRALPGTGFSFTQPIEMRVQELIGGVRSDVGIKVFGDDLPTLRRISNDISRLTAATPGAADVRTEPTSGLRLLTIRPDPLRLGRLGVRAPLLLETIETFREGRPLGKVIEGERRFDVMMRLATPPIADVEAAGEVRIVLDDSRWVPLHEIADLSLASGPAQVSREQARRRVMVETNVRGRDLGTFVEELRGRLATLRLPDGYYLEYGGQYENLARATARLSVLVPLTLTLVLVLLYLAFGAARPALLIFVNIPAAATGGVLALAARGLTFSISAAVGFLALFGVATLNGVVLLAAVRARQHEGQALRAAVEAATLERLRPVLTTALVAALGFFPMALATGTGAEVQRPLATVVIGGLVTSTLATLLVLPALYCRFGGEVASSEQTKEPAASSA